MKTKKISLGLMFASLFFVASCEKEKVEAIEDSVVPENVTDNRGGDHTVGYYHNEILDEIITKYRVVNAENMEDVYGDVKILSEGYVGGETFNYAEYQSYGETYIPHFDMTMEETGDVFKNDLISGMAANLNAARYITDSEESYYSKFNDEFYATKNYDEASAIVATYRAEITADRGLSEDELNRLNISFDIAEYSLFYWSTESDKGAKSAWPVISDGADDRMPKWLRVLLKVGADICGGAVGAGVGFAVGGVGGAIVGGVGLGAGCSAGMFNN